MNNATSTVAESNDAVDKVRAIPRSKEAEQAVIGGLLIDNPSWDAVSSQLSPQDFYFKSHQIIYQSLYTIADRHNVFDITLLSDHLEQHEQLKDAGGLEYLLEIVDNTLGASNVQAYASIVRERSILRQLLNIANRIAENVTSPQGKQSSDILNLAEESLSKIYAHQMQNSGPINATQILSSTLEKIQTLNKNASAITGVASGFEQLDKKTAGLQKSDLIIVAGRPSMGKTSFAMNIAENVIMSSEPGAVLIFSLEMSSEQLLTRVLSSLGRIDQTKMRTGDLNDQDWASLNSAINLMQNRPFYIDDTAGLSPNELKARARRVAREAQGIRLIVIDYLQLMQGNGTAESRTNEISEISRNLKALAKEMNCPVIALSQLNRSLEQRSDKRPMMSDLRESGAIEQDADVILFIYRDEVYNPDTPDTGTAEIIIGKQRNGPIGKVRLSFIGKLTRFENLIENKYEEYS